MNWFLPRPKPDGPSADWIRSLRTIDVAEALYRVEKMSKFAKLDDLLPFEQARFHRIAEHAVTLLKEDL
jgi:hypothetical protein